MGIAVVLAPAAFAAWAGAAPFDALARTYPGPGVAVLTAAVASLAQSAAAVTIGALAWHILSQPQTKGRPVAPEGPSLTILRVAAATWLFAAVPLAGLDRKSTRLNSSHVAVSYAVFCLEKKTKTHTAATV